MVALRKESVDRNMRFTPILKGFTGSLSARRAWIEIVITAMTSQISVSLSARRAWIEIDIPPNLDADRAVALRKESVDRNSARVMRSPHHIRSLSARRAWIEIPGRRAAAGFLSVALRKESVDRNQVVGIGLGGAPLSLSARRAWIEILSAVLTELLILCRSPQGERG